MEFRSGKQIDTTVFDELEDEDLKEIVLARQAILMPIMKELGEACISRNISYIVAVQMSPPDDPGDTPFAIGANVTEESDSILKVAIAFLNNPNKFVLVPRVLLTNQSIRLLQEMVQPPLRTRLKRLFKKVRRKLHVTKSRQRAAKHSAGQSAPEGDHHDL